MPTAASHNADAMKLDSKFFDRLRVKPDQSRLLRESCPSCEWKGCKEPGLYPAPKGRGQEGKYHRFCLDHVREYNKSYNYFAGLPDEDVIQHQKDDTVGHRPTWSLGVNSWARNRRPRNGARPGGFAHSFTTHDPFGLFAERDGKAEATSPSGRSNAWNGSACASSISRTAPPRPTSRRASRNWLSGSTPTITRATGAQRTSCAK